MWELEILEMISNKIFSFAKKFRYDFVIELLIKKH